MSIEVQPTIRWLAVALAVVAAAPAGAGGGTPVAPILLCRGLISFGDALARSVSMRVDLSRGEITTPDCRKYPHLARFCRGTLLSFGPHAFRFGGASSPENTEFWADLYRPSRLLSVAIDGTDIETMRVLFLGRCAIFGSQSGRPAALPP